MFEDSRRVPKYLQQYHLYLIDIKAVHPNGNSPCLTAFVIVVASTSSFGRKSPQPSIYHPNSSFSPFHHTASPTSKPSIPPHQFSSLVRYSCLLANMSMTVLNMCLEHRPIPPPNATVFYFSYDIRNYFGFKEKYPNARPLGVVWLGGWTWHVNQKGNPIVPK